MDAANEIQAEKAFSKQSGVFDGIYSNDTIIQYKRQRVRDHVNQCIPPNSSILELNAGTGEDAVFFAGQGHRVHATDLSTGMQEVLRKKVMANHLSSSVSQETCSYTSLEQLNNKGPYDLVFSNFAGLNCTNELDKVLNSLSPLLKPRGFVTLVVLPRFCLWELLLLFKGKTKTALRRFCGKEGAISHIEGEYFRCWYYNPSFIMDQLKSDFDVVSLEGLCTIVPPSYINGFAEKHPWVYNNLCKLEKRLRHQWPWRSIGDYFIISLQKKQA